MSKRVWKLQDFVAHSGSVHCARLGEKSGAVLATGGDDKRVNIWKVGKPHAMMSLTGHTSAVECLVFDKQEEVLVVGCAGGSMQVWNLEYRKMAGTLPGHRTACNSVEFHPYGEFFASGSSDTNLKIWDLRRKSCIQTYKGHMGAVTSIRFSPHGRWVATGGQDNMVKLWDLTAGKLMKDLDLHKGPITSLAFHPKEYLLATGSADRTMKLWSLESFRCAGSTDIATSSVQAVKFYVEESAVLCASNDALRVFATDGLSAPVDTIEVDWRGLQDMRLCLPEEKIMGVSTEGTQLGIWVADLQRGQPIGRGPGGNMPGRPARGAGGSYVPAKPQAPPPKSVSEPERVVPDQSEQVRNEDFEDLLRRPQGGACSPKPPQYGGVASPQLNDDPSDQAHGLPDRRRDEVRSRSHEQASQRAACSPKAHVAPSTRPAPGGAGVSPSGMSPGGGLADPFSRQGDLEQETSWPPAFAERRGSQEGMSAGVGAISPEETALPAGLAANSPAFTPKANGAEDRGMQSPKPPQRPPVLQVDPAEVLSKLSSQHPQMVGVLQRRLSQAKRVKELWAQGNLTGLSTGLQFPQDHAVVCDLARAVMSHRLVEKLNLDSCQILLPIIRELMTSKYDDFVMTAMQFSEQLLQHFGDLVTETRRSCKGIPERQLDLAREERLRKCNACHGHFCEIHKVLLESRFVNQLGGFRVSLQTFITRA